MRFPKDVKALIKTARDYKYEMRVLSAVEEVNDDQKSVLFNKAQKYFKNDLKGKTAGIWGLSFKPETDDIREAPSLIIIEKLIKAGVKVKVYDPVAIENFKSSFVISHKSLAKTNKQMTSELMNDIYYAKDDYDAIIDADFLFLITEWKEFRFPNLDVMKKIMKRPVIFDGRNIYDRKELEKKGFVYFCIGQK